jgi:hypothetical protein
MVRIHELDAKASERLGHRNVVKDSTSVSRLNRISKEHYE